MALAFTAFHVAILVIAAAIFIAAAVCDACSYRIPNYLSALLVGMFPLVVITAPHGIDWKQNSMIFGLVVLTGFILFLGKLIGAGDIKLLAAASLWAGPHLIAVLLIVTALVGGAVSIAMGVITHIRQRKNDNATEVELKKVPIPYGIAIAAGGLAMLGMMAQPILLPR